MKVITILGHGNDTNGNLSSIAQERLQRGWQEYQNCFDTKIILTGGFGAHFNQTKIPHYQYSKQYLMSLGAQEKDFLEFPDSSNTYQDAELSKVIIDKDNIKELIIVSSDFHLERVKIIFKRVFGPEYRLRFIAAKTEVKRLAPGEWEKKLAHEKMAIENLLKKN